MCDLVVGLSKDCMRVISVREAPATRFRGDR